MRRIDKTTPYENISFKDLNINFCFTPESPTTQRGRSLSTNSVTDSSSRPASCNPVFQITTDKSPPDAPSQPVIRPLPQDSGKVLTRRQSSPANLTVPKEGSNGRSDLVRCLVLMDLTSHKLSRYLALLEEKFIFKGF